MSYYLFQATYTREAIAAMVQTRRIELGRCALSLKEPAAESKISGLPSMSMTRSKSLTCRTNVDAVAFSMAGRRCVEGD